MLVKRETTLKDEISLKVFCECLSGEDILVLPNF